MQLFFINLLTDAINGREEYKSTYPTRGKVIKNLRIDTPDISAATNVYLDVDGDSIIIREKNEDDDNIHSLAMRGIDETEDMFWVLSDSVYFPHGHKTTVRVIPIGDEGAVLIGLIRGSIGFEGLDGNLIKLSRGRDNTSAQFNPIAEKNNKWYGFVREANDRFATVNVKYEKFVRNHYSLFVTQEMEPVDLSGGYWDRVSYEEHVAREQERERRRKIREEEKLNLLDADRKVTPIKKPKQVEIENEIAENGRNLSAQAFLEMFK